MSDTLASRNLRPAVPETDSNSASRSRPGRLVVNAAFLREIKDDNRHLKALWDRLLPMLSHPETARNHWRELISGLAELRDQLAIHFSLEEAYGYFDEAIDAAPRLSTQAEVLRSEHADLFGMIRDLADGILEFDGERPEHVTKLLSRFERFRRRFERHEEAELTLILESLDDDLGVGD